MSEKKAGKHGNVSQLHHTRRCSSVKQSIIAGLPTDAFHTVILEVCPASCKGSEEHNHATDKSLIRRERQDQALADPVGVGG
ncbi:hypothetical protein [Pantoea piersonii]|uniref:hypothetical protein n=1 Tax=Pantoea piersonii TaxID=2364647 RepID=UPI0028A99E49|nr:hypothetical protein [Pantoea piersonii]